MRRIGRAVIMKEEYKGFGLGLMYEEYGIGKIY
jgi:hypothetical protein